MGHPTDPTFLSPRYRPWRGPSRTRRLSPPVISQPSAPVFKPTTSARNTLRGERPKAWRASYHGLWHTKPRPCRSVEHSGNYCSVDQFSATRSLPFPLIELRATQRHSSDTSRPAVEAKRTGVCRSTTMAPQSSFVTLCWARRSARMDKGGVGHCRLPP
jgi:hypothetical protein